MENYIDVIKRIIELTDTIEEGIIYVDKQIETLNFGEASIVLRDIQAGMETIEKSLNPILELLPANNIEAMTDKLRNKLEQLIYFDNQRNIQEIKKIINGDFNMIYKEWQFEVKENLGTYILS